MLFMLDSSPSKITLSPRRFHTSPKHSQEAHGSLSPHQTDTVNDPRIALRARARRSPRIHLRRFSCDHSESHHGILASEKNTRNLDAPCARCGPTAATGQKRLGQMRAWDGSTITYVTEDGNVVMAPCGSEGVPDVLSVRDVGDGCVARVVRRGSAEGRAVGSIYGFEISGKGTRR